VPTGERDYSRTPLATKLGVRQGSRVLVLAPPDGFALRPLPDGVVIAPSARGRLDVVVLFTARRSELERRFRGLARALEPDGRLWVAWPKKASKLSTDLSFEIVQGIGLETGLVDNKSASIDERYQGLQFVYRLKDRRRRG
jgi:hypothetical protein